MLSLWLDFIGNFSGLPIEFVASMFKAMSGEFNFAPAETVCQDCIRASVEVALIYKNFVFGLAANLS